MKNNKDLITIEKALKKMGRYIEKLDELKKDKIH
tara:strand:+ start:52 stop:153 length:102 start_codon:yes stop_codon:yes gene_type:complete